MSQNRCLSVREVFIEAELFKVDRSGIRVSVTLPRQLVEYMDRLVERGVFKCRSQIIYEALRHYLPMIESKLGAPYTR